MHSYAWEAAPQARTVFPTPLQAWPGPKLPQWNAVRNDVCYFQARLWPGRCVSSLLFLPSDQTQSSGGRQDDRKAKACVSESPKEDSNSRIRSPSWALLGMKTTSVVFESLCYPSFVLHSALLGPSEGINTAT